MTTETPSGDYEKAYQALVNASGISVISRQSANALVDRMLQSSESSKATGITKRIAEAAAKGDTALIFALTDELKAVKDSEKSRSDRLKEVAEGFTFTELMRAFSTDYRELVHELATLVLQATEKGVADSRKRSRTSSENAQKRSQATPPTYIIHWKAQSIEATKQAGAHKLPSSEKEFYQFMGFEVTPDGKSLEPNTFKNKAGEVVTANKNAIIADLLAGNPVWKDQGYRIELKGENLGQVA